jgi:hypothetical protein
MLSTTRFAAALATLSLLLCSPACANPVVLPAGIKLPTVPSQSKVSLTKASSVTLVSSSHSSLSTKATTSSYSSLSTKATTSSHSSLSTKATTSSHSSLSTKATTSSHSSLLTKATTSSHSTSSINATLSVTSTAVSQTTCSPDNPNGPYCNLNDYVPLPFTWPGKPTKGQTQPPPRPTPVWNYGGKNSSFYQAPAWIPKGSNLIPALKQSETNGNSLWGTLLNPPLSSTGPFGNSSATNSTLAACGTMPNTGVTRSYNFNVSYHQIAPDGVQKNGLVVNGGFPGPLIEANCKLFFVSGQ